MYVCMYVYICDCINHMKPHFDPKPGKYLCHIIFNDLFPHHVCLFAWEKKLKHNVGKTMP